MAVLLLIGGLTGVIIDLLAIIYWAPPKNNSKASGKQPMVSILIAMRNEAHNVKGLIENLKQLDYPRDKLQILIGNDRSEDETDRLLRKEAASDDRFTVFNIDKDLHNLKAKANVIAQLIGHSSSAYYFITDADVRVPRDWLNSLLDQVDEKTGVIGGCTVVDGKNLWARLQNMDWLLAQGLILATGNLYRTVAVSGTNMMITREACDAIGGYHKIPYSLTEDIGFLSAAQALGYKAKNILTPGAMATIESQPNWQALIGQRQRWAYGVLRLPLPLVMLLILRALFLPLILTLAWWQPFWSLGLLMARWSAQYVLVMKVAIQLHQKVDLITSFWFEFYHALVSLGSLLKYIFPGKISWKGREY